MEESKNSERRHRIYQFVFPPFSFSSDLLTIDGSGKKGVVSQEVEGVGRSDGVASRPVEVESGPVKVTGGLCRRV